MTIGANCGWASSINIKTKTDASFGAKCLTSVAGNLYIDGNTNGGSNAQLASIMFPKLTSVAGNFQVWNSAGSPGNTALASIDLNALVSVGGSFGIFWNPALKSLSLPALTFVQQWFGVYSNGFLTTLSAPSMVTIANHGNLLGWALKLCNNAASFSYSIIISHAAAQQTCYLTNANCAAAIMCPYCDTANHYYTTDSGASCIQCLIHVPPT